MLLLPRNALPKRPQRKQIAEVILRSATIKITRQWIRSAGPALIDQDNVPTGSNLRESPCNELRVVGRSLSRPAGQDEKWIRFPFRRARGKHHDFQRNTATIRVRSVFKNFVSPAANFTSDTIDCASFRLPRRDLWRSEGSEQENAAGYPNQSGYATSKHCAH